MAIEPGYCSLIDAFGAGYARVVTRARARTRTHIYNVDLCTHTHAAVVADATPEMAQAQPPGQTETVAAASTTTALLAPTPLVSGNSFGCLCAAPPPAVLEQLLSDGPGATAVARRLGGELRELWVRCGGLLVLRGLQGAPPPLLVTLVSLFGEVGNATPGPLQVIDNATGAPSPLRRLGNKRDLNGNLIASFKEEGIFMPSDDENAAQVLAEYNPVTRRPVWHTDGTHNAVPPIGQALFCQNAPPAGGDTLFADTAAGLAALPPSAVAWLRESEAVCSRAHHDAKIHSYTPSQPTLTPAERATNPPRRVPMIVRHPLSGHEAFYGLNSATCAVVPKGAVVSKSRGRAHIFPPRVVAPRQTDFSKLPRSLADFPSFESSGRTRMLALRSRFTRMIWIASTYLRRRYVSVHAEIIQNDQTRTQSLSCRVCPNDAKHQNDSTLLGVST